MTRGSPKHVVIVFFVMNQVMNMNSFMALNLANQDEAFLLLQKTNSALNDLDATKRKRPISSSKRILGFKIKRRGLLLKKIRKIEHWSGVVQTKDPDGEIENSGKSIFEIRIPNFCYIQISKFANHEKIVKNIKSVLTTAATGR